MDKGKNILTRAKNKVIAVIIKYIKTHNYV